MIYLLTNKMMNLKTFTKRYNSLSSELYKNPFKSEILNIMQQQINDDTSVIPRQVISKPSDV